MQYRLATQVNLNPTFIKVVYFSMLVPLMSFADCPITPHPHSLITEASWLLFPVDEKGKSNICDMKLLHARGEPYEHAHKSHGRVQNLMELISAS